MTIKSVSFHKTYNLGNYCSEKLGVEIDLEPRDDLQKVIDHARELVDLNHKTNNPDLYGRQVKPQPMEERIIQNQSLQPKMSDNEISDMHSDKPFDLVGAINSCEGLGTLKSYKFLHKQSPEATAAYDKKLNELTNG